MFKFLVATSAVHAGREWMVIDSIGLRLIFATNADQPAVEPK